MSSSPETKELLRRIDELEALVKQQVKPTSSNPAQPEPTPATTHMAPFPVFHEAFTDVPELPAAFTALFSPTNLEAFPPMPNFPASSPSGVEQINADEEPLTIPIGHLTATGTLFSLEPVLKLIGEYPEDYFYQIETARQFDLSMFGGVPVDLSPDHVESLLDAFFSEIHPHFPILDPESFRASFHNTINSSTEDSASRALCFVVLALGQLACKRHIPSSPSQNVDFDGAGMDYFALAYSIATARWVTSFNFSVPLCSALVYCAIFLCYLQYPLQAWRFVHMASTKLQMMLAQ